MSIYTQPLWWLLIVTYNPDSTTVHQQGHRPSLTIADPTLVLGQPGGLDEDPRGRHTDQALRLLQEQGRPLSSRLLPLKELLDVSESAIQPLSQRRDVVTGVQNVRHPTFPLLLPQLVGVGRERWLSPFSSNLQCDPTDGQHPPHSQDDEV